MEQTERGQCRQPPPETEPITQQDTVGSKESKPVYKPLEESVTVLKGSSDHCQRDTVPEAILVEATEDP